MTRVPDRYRPLVERVVSSCAQGDPIESRMRVVADAIWEAMGWRPEPGEPHPEGRPYSWIGFYTREDGADEMVLAPSRDTPACNPIGLHGMCGRSCVDGAPVLIDDVRTLGEHYVACDPRDQSEIVIPVFEESGRCFGVLDGDSFDLNAFDEDDIAGLTALVEASGLTTTGHAAALLRL
ncbi:MAG: GAF domain-containing protein [Planctomycetota bacterium]